jgi:hypothetical protein
MSFHNRLLLNRAAISGTRTIEVMLATTADGIPTASTLVTRLGGRVRRIEEPVGYMRIDLPIERLLDLVNDPSIVAYQIASFSKGTWYRDGPPESNAEMFRGFETSAPSPAPPPAPSSTLPAITPEQAAEVGYTADGPDDGGIREFLAQHPTYDGRGVTIALLEDAKAEFTHPTIGNAKTLDGRDVPKLAGILNAIDPERPDETRVLLGTPAECATAWCRINDRTYILPRAGMYSVGLFTLPAGANAVHQFAVLRDERTSELWVDTNGNGDFRDETPIADVNERFDPRTLKLTYPRPGTISFVLARGSGRMVHIYVGSSGHQAMILSVAAGSRTDGGLAYGAAPGARVLLVRNSSASDFRLRDFVETYLTAVKRPDVDVLSEAGGILTIPDTGSDFIGLLFNRIVAAYGKPIFHGAGNTQLWPNSVSAHGDAFAVGGSISPSTFAALYGGATLERPMVHWISTAGPALDGALKPDFLAPVNRISAGVWGVDSNVLLPKNAPRTRLPPGYEISCCTSASGPYAAGIGALLLSAAKQAGVPYSVATLGRALRASARFLPGWPAYQQGSGLVDVNAAWREMNQRIDPPRIRVRASVVHPLAQYSLAGGHGQGLFEREGWGVGMSGHRTLSVRRESGPKETLAYRVRWTGNDGTFSTASNIELPLNIDTPLSVGITVSSPGAHSAILNLDDAVTGANIFRTEATIVAASSFDPDSQTLRIEDTVGLMRTATHYFEVPGDVMAMSVELEVKRGAVRASLLASHSLQAAYYAQVFPVGASTLAKGTYRALIPYPSPGAWALTMANVSAWRERDLARVSTEPADYVITCRLLRASLSVTKIGDAVLDVEMDNAGSELREPILETSLGTLKTHRGTFLANGLPNQFVIDVPTGAARLALHVRDADPSSQSLELYLYDCTTGECFSYTFTLPAAHDHSVIVRQPKPGRWIAAVNRAPFPAGPGGFVLDEVLTFDVTRRRPATDRPRPPHAHWTERAGIPTGSDHTEHMRILLLELIDAALDRETSERPWDDHPLLPKLTHRAAAGFSIHYLN